MGPQLSGLGIPLTAVTSRVWNPAALSWRDPEKVESAVNICLDIFPLNFTPILKNGIKVRRSEHITRAFVLPLSEQVCNPIPLSLP